MSDQRPPRQRRTDYRAFVPITSRWSDNDMFGHLNNAAYYSLFDTAVTTWLFRSDLAAGGARRMFFVAETGCRYLSEIAYPDRIEVGLRIAKIGSSSVRYEIGVFRNDEEEAAAEGLFVHVHIDPKTRRPAPLEKEARAVLEGIAL